MKLSRFILILCLIAVGCVKQNERPAFLVIESATLVHEKLNRTFPVSTVWVYQNTLVGAFQTPVKVPILNLNTDTFNFRGAEWHDGDPAFRPLYPFWSFDTVSHHFTSGEEFRFNPTFRYYPDSLLTYPFKEDFESGLVKFKLNPSIKPHLTGISLTDDRPFEGRYCGRVNMTLADSSTNLDIVSTDAFDLPRNKEVWLEVAYRGNAVLATGLGYFTDAGNEVYDEAFIKRAGYTYFDDDWHRAYFNLKPLVDDITQIAPNTKYRLRFYSVTATKDRELNLDYIRIIHFK